MFFYIPYNCQFLIVKEYESGNDAYVIEELYHKSIYDPLSSRNFGKWQKSKGFEIPERNFYKKRFDLGDTILHALCYASINMNANIIKLKE